jgi:hypothetical protein
LSTRHVEELMQERGVSVDHSTINRWVVKYSPQPEEAFHRRKRPVWINGTGVDNLSMLISSRGNGRARMHQLRPSAALRPLSPGP